MPVENGPDGVIKKSAQICALCYSIHIIARPDGGVISGWLIGIVSKRKSVLSAFLSIAVFVAPTVGNAFAAVVSLISVAILGLFSINVGFVASVSAQSALFAST